MAIVNVLQVSSMTIIIADTVVVHADKTKNVYLDYVYVPMDFIMIATIAEGVEKNAVIILFAILCSPHVYVNLVN